MDLGIRRGYRDALGAIHEFLHGDRVRGTTRSAQGAPDAGGFVFQHDRAELVQLLRREALKLPIGHAKLSRRGGHPVIGVQKLAESHQANEVLRTDVHASVAGYADRSIENGVDVAAQAAGGLPPRLGFPKPLFDILERGGPPLAFDDGRILPRDRVPAFRHGVGRRRPLAADGNSVRVPRK